MRACDRRMVCMLAVAGAVAFMCQVAEAQFSVDSYDYADVGVAPGDMESVFGTKVAELDAKGYGFNFQFKRDGTGQPYDDPFHGHRNLNVISQVFVAQQAVTIGTGNGGTTIELQPGDYTFAYTLDFSQLDFILTDSAVQDFQILRTVFGANPPLDNPGPNLAIDMIIAGAYNTDAAFGSGAGTPPLVAYPNGMKSAAVSFPMLVASNVEYDWGSPVVTPESKAMVLMFTSPDVDIWQVGWGSLGGEGLATMAEREIVGHTGEGGSTVGGGQSIPDSIPVLIPVVPEPATFTLLIVGFVLVKRRRV